MISGETHQYRRHRKADAILPTLLLLCGVIVNSRLLKSIPARFYGIKCQGMLFTALRKWSRITIREMDKSTMGTPSADMMYPYYTRPRPISPLTNTTRLCCSRTLHALNINFICFLASKRCFWRTHWNEVTMEGRQGKIWANTLLMNLYCYGAMAR